MQFINASKSWPLNLGVGKPYDEDIDLRLEEWMSFLCYQKTGNTKQAQTSLQNIIHAPGNYPSANELVTAWAMEQLNQKKEAIKRLDQLIEKYTGNKILLWCKGDVSETTNRYSIGQ